MINKKRAINMMRDFSDFIIDFSNKRESIAATIDFDNKYIRSIRRYKNFQFKGNILIFNWTDNDFEAIPIKDIARITPLSSILDNIKDNG